MVMIAGAHTLGRTHYNNSGYYSLPWTRYSHWLDNEYYKLMIDTSQYWMQYPSKKDNKIR